ncbi:MAG: tetratricopeptide repeat protein, partial [bacterium]
KLRGYKYIEIDPDDPESYEDGIMEICSRLKRPYFPPFKSDSRLPLLDRFTGEIRDLNLSPHQYKGFGKVIEKFTTAFSQGDWLESENLISYFIKYFQYNIPNIQLYYPLVVKGVCELQLGRFVEAKETFSKAAQHPKADANSFGGLGHVYFRQQRYEEALARYEKALSISPGEESWEIRFNILGIKIQLGLDIDDDMAILEKIEYKKLKPDELIKVMNMKGIAFFKKGDYLSSLKIFESMHREGHYDATSICYHHSCLRSMGKIREAIELLCTEAEHLEKSRSHTYMGFVEDDDGITLYHHLADLYIQARMMDQALRIYEDKLCKKQGMDRQFMVEHARILIHVGREEEAMRVCEEVLNRKYFLPPKTSKEFFYDGFANYLLGNHERARYDYERSLDFYEKYYDAINLYSLE